MTVTAAHMLALGAGPEIKPIPFHTVPDTAVRRRGNTTMTTTTPSAAGYHLHEHLTAGLHALLDLLDRHGPEITPIHVCAGANGLLRICVITSGAPLVDRQHAVDVLADELHLPHAEPSDRGDYAAQQGEYAVWTLNRTEAGA